LSSLYRVDLVQEWYDFKYDAYLEIAKEWCEDNKITYVVDKSEKSTKK